MTIPGQFLVTINNSCFVCDFGIFGEPPAETPLLRFSSNFVSQRTGRSDHLPSEYIRLFEEFAKESDVLWLAILCGLLPPLALRVGELQGFAINLVGPSSTGKTLALRAAQSVFARAEETDLQTFNLSRGSVAPELAWMSGTAVPFKDIKAAVESGAAHVEKVRQMLFAVHGADARVTLTTGHVQPPKFALPMLSDERSLAERYAAARQVYEEGDRVRCVEIQVPDIAHGGIFNRMNDANGDPTSRMESLSNFLDGHYGVVFPAWIAAICSRDVGELETEFREHATAFGKRLDCVGPLEHRFARPFKFLAAAAVIAANAGLLDSATSAQDALVRLFEVARRQLHQTSAKVADGLARFLAVAADRTRFPVVVHGEAADPRECGQGFLRTEGSVEHLYVRREFFNDFFGSDGGTQMEVLRAMKHEGILLAAGGGFTKPAQQLGLDRMRYLDFDYRSLERNVIRALDGKRLLR
jgi:hypothetical protein